VRQYAEQAARIRGGCHIGRQEAPVGALEIVRRSLDARQNCQQAQAHLLLREVEPEHAQDDPVEVLHRKRTLVPRAHGGHQFLQPVEELETGTDNGRDVVAVSRAAVDGSADALAQLIHDRVAALLAAHAGAGRKRIHDLPLFGDVHVPAPS